MPASELVTVPSFWKGSIVPETRSLRSRGQRNDRDGEDPQKRILLHQKSCGLHPFKPYGQAIRLIGLSGHLKLPADPGRAEGVWQVVVEANRFSSHR